MSTLHRLLSLLDTAQPDGTLPSWMYRKEQPKKESLLTLPLNRERVTQNPERLETYYNELFIAAYNFFDVEWHLSGKKKKQEIKKILLTIEPDESWGITPDQASKMRKKILNHFFPSKFEKEVRDYPFS